MTSDSDFGSYRRYLQWVTFLTTFRKDVLAGNRNGVSWLMAWPWLWNHGGRSTPIALRTSFFARYRAVFTPSVLAAVRTADPRALFCRDESEVMLGSGVVWGGLQPHGLLAIISINAPSA